MKKNIQLDLLIIFAIAVLVSSFFAITSDHPVIKDDDAGQYDTIGWNLSNGNGFSMSGSAPYEPTMLREPVYPLFLSSVYKLFGHNTGIVILFQIIIFALTCVVTYFISYNIFGQKIALWAAILTALSPAMANYPSYLLSETLFTFLLCLAMLCLTMGTRSKTMRWFFMAGVTFGLCVLTKSVMLLFPIVLLFGLFAALFDKKPSFKLPLSYFLVFIIPFFMIVGLWSHRNHSDFGTYQISLRGGAALWETGQRMDKTTEDMKHDIIYNFSEYLGNKIFPGLTENPRDYILQGSKKAYNKGIELAKQRLNPVEIDNIMRKEAIEKIKEHPLKFIVYIPIEFIKMTAFIYVPTLNESHIIEKFHSLSNGRIILSSIRGIFRLSVYPFLLISLVGIILNRKSWRDWCFLLGIILYINLIYSMLFAMGRYAVPLIPFYSIFASAGILKLLENNNKAKQNS